MAQTQYVIHDNDPLRLSLPWCSSALGPPSLSAFVRIMGAFVVLLSLLTHIRLFYMFYT